MASAGTSATKKNTGGNRTESSFVNAVSSAGTRKRRRGTVELQWSHVLQKRDPRWASERAAQVGAEEAPGVVLVPAAVAGRSSGGVGAADEPVGLSARLDSLDLNRLGGTFSGSVTRGGRASVSLRPEPWGLQVS